MKSSISSNKTKCQIATLIFSCMCITIITAILLPIISANIINNILNKNISLLNENIKYIMLSALLAFPIYMLKNHSYAKAIAYSVIDVQGGILQNIGANNNLALIDLKYIQAVISQSVPKYCTEMVNLIQLVTVCAVSIIIGGYYGVINNIYVLILTVVITGVIIILNKNNSEKVEKHSMAYQEKHNELNKKIWDNVDNHEISTFLQEDKVLKGFDDTNKEYLSHLLTLKKSSNSVSMFSSFGTTAIVTIIIIFGGILNYFGYMEYAEIYAFALIMPNVSVAIFNIPKIKNDYKNLKGLWFTFNEYTLEPDKENKKELQSEIFEIDIRNLTYQYNGSNNKILENINIKFSKGDFVGIKGKSGCGKSTLIKLVLGLIYTDKSIYINNLQLENISRKSFLNKISYIRQDAFVIDGTIKKNITLDKTSKHTLDEVIKMANLEELVSKLPEGIDSRVKDLSSGEKQKVCFARAFWQDKCVIICDESTSAMDEDSQDKILKTLSQLSKKGKIIIAISHNDLFLKSCDKIIDLPTIQYKEVNEYE